MDIRRADVISLYDLEFKGDVLSSKDRKILQEKSQQTHMGKRFSSSFSWLFYGEQLPGSERFSLPVTSKEKSQRGACVLVDADNAIGVYSVWNSLRDQADPLALKRNAWELSSSQVEDFNRLGLDLEEVERHYPFVAIQAEASDLPQFCANNAEDLGRLFTGDYESEDPSCLKEYISGNLSRRSYERLLIRWTEALAVYAGDISEDQYENSLFRAVQVFEACIMVRALFRKISKRADSMKRKLIVFTPHPWAVKGIMNSMAAAEETFIVSPPVSSVEAERLLLTSYERFGIGKTVESARRVCESLDNRFQWVKAQILGGVAVAVFVIDTLLKWKGK